MCPIKETCSFYLMDKLNGYFKIIPQLLAAFWISHRSLQGFTTGLENRRINMDKLQQKAVKVNEAILK